ncbi:MAG: hypothetical protein Q4E75_06640, partial [bacterium]|nr:hypothetical protein [bacterium]
TNIIIQIIKYLPNCMVFIDLVINLDFDLIYGNLGFFIILLFKLVFLIIAIILIFRIINIIKRDEYSKDNSREKSHNKRSKFTMELLLIEILLIILIVVLELIEDYTYFHTL